MASDEQAVKGELAKVVDAARLDALRKRLAEVQKVPPELAKAEAAPTEKEAPEPVAKPADKARELTAAERRVLRAQQTGFAVFLAKEYKDEDVTTKNVADAVLALAASMEKVRAAAEKGIHEVNTLDVDRLKGVVEQVEARFGEVHESFQQSSAQFVKVLDLLAAMERRLRRALLVEAVLLRYATALDEWRALSWWQRRKTPRPVCPNPRDLLDAEQALAWSGLMDIVKGVTEEPAPPVAVPDQSPGAAAETESAGLPGVTPEQPTAGPDAESAGPAAAPAHQDAAPAAEEPQVHPVGAVADAQATGGALPEGGAEVAGAGQQAASAPESGTVEDGGQGCSPGA